MERKKNSKSTLVSEENQDDSKTRRRLVKLLEM